MSTEGCKPKMVSDNPPPSQMGAGTGNNNPNQPKAPVDPSKIPMPDPSTL